MAVTYTYLGTPDYHAVIDCGDTSMSVGPSEHGADVIITHASGATITVAATITAGWRCRITNSQASANSSVAVASGVTGRAANALGAAPWTIAPGGSVELVAYSSTLVYAFPAAGATAGSSTVYVATRAALKAIAAANRVTGQMAIIATDMSAWVFDGASSATVDGADMVMITPSAGSGRWVRLDKNFMLKLPFTYATADAATLFTVPTGMMMRITGTPFWDIATNFTGGSSSAIGVSVPTAAGDTGYNSKGDLLGGATGDVAAALVAARNDGTVGTEFSAADTGNTSLAEIHTLLLDAGDTIRFDRITSAFTAGAGNVCMPVSIGFSGAVT